MERRGYAKRGLDSIPKFCPGKVDRNDHPIPLLACGPGTGKSRFLQEIGIILRQKAISANAFSNVLSVYLIYGNDTPASCTDARINGQASVATRLLYEYFISSNQSRPKALLEDIQNSKGVMGLTLSTAINVIYLDFTRRVASTIPTVPPTVLVLDIDEVNQLHALDQEVFRNFLNAIGGKLAHPFCISILLGTIQGPLEETVTELTYRLLQLPLPLTEQDVIKIGSTLYLTRDDTRIHLPNQYLQNNNLNGVGEGHCFA